MRTVATSFRDIELRKVADGGAVFRSHPEIRAGSRVVDAVVRAVA